ncbi:pirin family protein [soil metagenome]
MPVTTEIRRGSERFVERQAGRLSRHSFAFGADYDAGNLRFGPMVCHDDHLLGVGQGFETHRHSDLVIVTWVLSGALAHTDSSGTYDVVTPGEVAVLRTGEGVEHSEVASAPQTRFVQVWLAPEQPDEVSSYDVTPAAVVPGELSVVATPLPGATFSVARLETGDVLALPAAPLSHVYVARGALLRSSLAEPLQDGDAFRFTDEPSYEVTAAVPTELLVWSFA